MYGRKAVSLVTLVFLVGLLVPNLSVGAASPARDGQVQVVRVPTTAMSQVEVLELNPRLNLDYGSFAWLELDSADYARLVASQSPFVPVPEAGMLQVQGYRFDPVLDGEPLLSADMEADEDGPGLRLVQLVGPAQDGWLAQLEAVGLPLLQYYPYNAYLTWAAAAEAEAVEALDFVRWQGAFYPGYKIAKELDGRSGPIHNVDVMFYNDGNLQATLDALTALGGTILDAYPSQPDKAFYDAVIQLDASALADVARLNTVLWLGYLSPEPLLDDEMSSQIVAGNYTSGVPSTGYFTWLGNIGYDGSGVRWAIVDTGVDYDHPDLGPHIAGGYNFPGACSYPGQPGSDCSNGGHGTHVAGIVGGDASAGFMDPQGFLYGLGIAPTYEIFAMNSLSASAWPPAGGWQEHSKQAVLGGAIGGNNSWTTSEGTNHGYQASERTHDFMVRDGNFDTTAVAEPFIEVFSAGNSGPGSHTLTSPKEAKNLIVVASSRNYRVGSIDTLSNFSSRGPAADGRWVPTVAAPGEQIASTRNDVGGVCATPIGGTNNLYAFCSGTSMAAPHVSGSITLLTEWWRSFNAGADPSPAMAKALLVSGAVDMNEGNAVPNMHEGWGRVNLTNVLDNGAAMLYRDQTHTFDNTGESWTITVGVPDPSKPLKVSVAWSDAPGAVGANPALVNNLDLVVDNGGNTYLGNVFSSGWSTPGGSPDTINNLENVFVQNPGGSATITIQATNIAGDGVPISGDATDQDFALVCYNCALQSDFSLAATPSSQDVCAPADAVYDVEVGSILGYADPVTLSASGQPAGTTVSFSVNPVTPPGSSTLTIANTGAATAGSYSIDIVGVAPTSTHTTTVGLNLYSSPSVSLESDGPVFLGEPVHLTATLESGTPPLIYTWDLDGATPVFTYTADGTFTTVVTVENGCGVDVATTTVTVFQATIELTKTVGTDAGVCAASDAIEVAPGTDVYYCYEVRNTGTYTLPLHDLVDSEKGAIFTGLAYDLAPGASIDTVAAGLTVSATITQTVVNTATWTAYEDGGPSAVATDMATVTVLPPSIELTKTVGTDAGVCATTDLITVTSGTDVYYCYEVRNTGTYTMSLHDLEDNELGILLAGFYYDLGPGDSVDTVAAGLTFSATLTETTVNTATWTVFYPPHGPAASASDTATVVVVEPQRHWLYLPIIVKNTSP